MSGTTTSYFIDLENIPKKFRFPIIILLLNLTFTTDTITGYTCYETILFRLFNQFSRKRFHPELEFDVANNEFPTKSNLWIPEIEPALLQKQFTELKKLGYEESIEVDKSEDGSCNEVDDEPKRKKPPKDDTGKRVDDVEFTAFEDRLKFILVPQGPQSSDIKIMDDIYTMVYDTPKKAGAHNIVIIHGGDEAYTTLINRLAKSPRRNRFKFSEFGIKSQEELIKRMQMVKDESKNLFPCSICGRVFETKRSMGSHKGWHSREKKVGKGDTL
ncbi:hypothetical protein HK098_006548 [Nowakowskiella sp. JEL0407]|nr:hypothetical protein HK098_006548 [Nowakowskiella sp. JEL0407]